MNNYIQTYEKFSADKLKKQILAKISNLKLKDVIKLGKDYKDRIWEITKREGQETAQASAILRKMIAGEEVSDNEKKFLRHQSLDLVRVISAASLPIPISAILVALGKKYNFEVFPTAQDDLKKEIESEKEAKED